MIDGSKVPGCASAAALTMTRPCVIRQVIDVERTVPEPGVRECLAQRAAREARLAVRHHAQGDDAALGFIRPGQHQLRAVHRLLFEHAHR